MRRATTTSHQIKNLLLEKDEVDQRPWRQSCEGENKKVVAQHIPTPRAGQWPGRSGFRVGGPHELGLPMAYDDPGAWHGSSDKSLKIEEEISTTDKAYKASKHTVCATLSHLRERSAEELKQQLPGTNKDTAVCQL